MLRCMSAQAVDTGSGSSIAAQGMFGAVESPASRDAPANLGELVVEAGQLAPAVPLECLGPESARPHGFTPLRRTPADGNAGSGSTRNRPRHQTGWPTRPGHGDDEDNDGKRTDEGRKGGKMGPRRGPVGGRGR